MTLLDPVVRGVLAPLARLLYRPTVLGREQVPAKGPVILASNHLSFVDSVVIPLLTPRPVVFLAKAEYFTGRGLKGRLTRAFFTAIGSVPVRRGANRSALRALDAAVEVLADGRMFGIYPEGTRSLDGRLHRGRTGVAWLAMTSRAPVLPVALAGTEQILPVGRRWPRIRPVTLRFGPPLDFAHRHGEAASARARREVTDEIMRAIGELSGQERATGYHPAPVE
ncbi:lysophospholipid acyltransferase family protein [Micromonospora zhanjiangensis]|uniref:Lysophospholipid acyltransferase family protein n=1 Tax=Micromonospora zhanjiangensis TaxID=1522057 RepID=A0ABV8KIF4_9ACTN